jgi:hypothetical protein
VGERGTIVRRMGPGERWVEDTTSPDTRALRDRPGSAMTEAAIAVGRNGIIIELHDGEWVRVPAESERHFRAVMVTDANAFALGSDRFVNRLAPPSADHWFGTDHLGRDLYSQNVHGSRIALIVGFIGAALVVLIGANVGLIAGYYRGRTETVLMRIVDVMYGIPFEPFALILVLLFEPSLLIVILAVSLLTWRTVARLIRSSGAFPARAALREGGAGGGRVRPAHHVSAHLPECDAAGLPRTRHHRRCVDHRRGDAFLPRARAAAIDLLGRHPAQCAAVRRLAHGLVVEPAARLLHHDHGAFGVLHLALARGHRQSGLRARQ